MLDQIYLVSGKDVEPLALERLLLLGSVLKRGDQVNGVDEHEDICRQRHQRADFGPVDVAATVIDSYGVAEHVKINKLSQQ